MENIYTCSFCGKKGNGKPLSFLKRQEDRDKVIPNGSNVALMPIGWDWNLVPTKFTNSFSCGCHIFNK